MQMIEINNLTPLEEKLMTKQYELTKNASVLLSE
jgi:hypothetical protein